MSLHVDSFGSGAPLLLIHGWGMHGGMWGEAAAQLARNFRVHCVDLPGHGRSAGSGQWGVERGEGALDGIVGMLSAQFSEPLTVCGWSLGGIIAQRWAALEPHKVRRLVLVASTPCFVRRPGWECAMAEEDLRQFAAALEQDHAATLRRFLALQLRGSANERELLAELRERLFSRGEPGMAALRAGLEILRDTDLRAVLPQIGQPALVIAGGRDRLTPPQASRHLAQAMPDARLIEIEGAAHAPFLSHPDEFVKQVAVFIEER
ncbi:MAG: pimeloyl-[acyl-carrier protein] methyl ester esterase [Gallionellales bacterium GWA2_60_18]|nr:MAG: pimeloyl-[acyl-carrier protein] methyl ester esterase [Gallionellales bacterium GWA2_60_18]